MQAVTPTIDLGADLDTFRAAQIVSTVFDSVLFIRDAATSRSNHWSVRLLWTSNASLCNGSAIHVMLRKCFWAALALWALHLGPAWAAKDTYADGVKAYRAGEYTKAYRALLPLARKNDARAMYLVGVMYEGGRGVPQDDPTAAGWFGASVRRGYAPAQYALARMVIEGRGAVKSRERGISLLRAAAGQGHQEAAALLGRVDPALATASANREPVPRMAEPAVGAVLPAPAAKPVAVAFTKFERPDAQASLAALRGVLQRLTQADNAEIRKSLSLLSLDFARQYWHIESVGDVELATIYARLVRDHSEVLSQLAREMSAAPPVSAQQGVASRLESLATGGLLARLTSPIGAGAREGCPATIEAAQGGFPFAWFEAARCVVVENPQQAGDWMLMAAATGHAGAQESAGRACVESASKDWGCAKEWLGLAVNAGRSSAIPILAWTLANQPQASDLELRAAVKWYETAAGTGDALSMNNLAALLERGPEGVRDPVRARDWYGQAARSGYAPAQFNLGRMLAQGEGGAANRDEAVEWLRKAEAAGIAEARLMRERISR